MWFKGHIIHIKTPAEELERGRKQNACIHEQSTVMVIRGPNVVKIREEFTNRVFFFACFSLVFMVLPKTIVKVY